MVGVAVCPQRLVRHAVDALVGSLAPGDPDPGGLVGAEAEVVVSVGGLLVTEHTLFGAGGALSEWGVVGVGNNVRAVVEMADLVRESDVVRVRGPDDARVLRRGAVH